MEDTEPDTFVYKTWPEKFVDMLAEIGVESEAKEIATVDLDHSSLSLLNNLNHVNV